MLELFTFMQIEMAIPTGKFQPGHVLRRKIKEMMVRRPV
jgi:hypothetical protein